MRKSSRRNKLTDDAVNDMLVWWVALDKNATQVGKKTGHSAKVVIEIAKRENFEAKAPLVRDKVNELMYGTSNPNMVRVASMGLDLLQINSMLITQVKESLQGKKKVKFNSPREIIDVLKYIRETEIGMTGDKNPEKTSLEDEGRRIGQGIAVGIQEVFANLDDEGRDRFLANARRTAITGNVVDVDKDGFTIKEK